MIIRNGEFFCNSRILVSVVVSAILLIAKQCRAAWKNGNRTDRVRAGGRLERGGRSVLLMEKPGRHSGNYCHVLYANGEIKQIPACR